MKNSRKLSKSENKRVNKYFNNIKIRASGVPRARLKSHSRVEKKAHFARINIKRESSRGNSEYLIW